GTGQRWPVRGARGAGAGRPALGDGGTAALPQLQHRHGAADRGADATDRAQAQSLRHSLAGGEAGPAAGLHRPGQPGAQARAQPPAPAVLLPGRARLLRLHVHGGAGAPPARPPAAAADMTSPAVHPCFLGPYGENDALLERLVVEFLRDHVYWRRNFHPEDPPAIPTGAADEPAFREFEARMRRELHALSAALKRSVPFHSPRYIGHMVSDLLLPGLAAQFLTLPYNPNNVSLDAAPVTIDLELKVGLQLARMFGYVADPARPDCAFGHLTSGGTLANFQALRLALTLKAFPVALRAVAPPGLALPEDDRSAFNLAPAAAIALLEQWNGLLAGCEPRERRRWRQALAAHRLETLGLAEFLARHPGLESPRVLAPVTAHYSWSKGMKLMGLGRARLELVPERGMRI